ncbi:MAG TPA: tetratricopeptide repeat protein [Pyrinomonadaceae bacterium]
MTTASRPEPKSAQPYESLVDMIVAYNSLTREYGETLERNSSSRHLDKLLDRADEFVSRGCETGKLLNDTDERWEAQDMLNFWAKILYRHRRQPGEEPLMAVLSPFGSVEPTDAESAPIYFELPSEPLEVYVGRENFLSDLKQQLLAGRNVALYSSPGTGKTSIAAKLAHDPDLREKYPDGVLWTSLGEQPEVSTILRNWAKALKVLTEEDPDSDLLDQEHTGNLIRRALGRRRMLLVITDAWQPEAALALKLGGPDCAHILTTYLMPVAVGFDAQAPVRVHRFCRSDGLRLFTSLAPKAVEGQEDEVRKLVRALDHSPLALALIATYYERQHLADSKPDLKRLRQRLLKEKEVIEAERSSALLTVACDDVLTPASLLAAIGWCFEQLGPEEKYVLEAFSAFPPKPNRFSDAAARSIIESRTGSIEKLLDYGLLEKPSDDRYSLHRAVSDFLKRRTHAFTDNAAEQRMVDYYVNLAKMQATNLHVLEQEEKNILAALEVAYKLDLWQAVVEGTNALFGYFDRRGLYVRAEETLDRARKAAQQLNDDSLANILLKIGEINERRSEYVNANKHLQESLEIARKFENDDLCARALQVLGVVSMAVAKYEDAERYLTEALDLARKIKNTDIECAIETRLGWMERGLGRFKESRERTERALKLAQRFHYIRQAAELKLSLGVLDFFELDYKQAKKHDLEGLRYAERAEDKRLQCALHQALGGVEIELESFEKAEAHLMKSLHLSMEIGHRWYNGVIWKELGELKLRQNLPNAAAGAFKNAADLAREVNSPELIGLVLYGLARVAEAQQNYVEARLQGQNSLNIFESIGHHKKSEVKAWIKSINSKGHTSEQLASEAV